MKIPSTFYTLRVPTKTYLRKYVSATQNLTLDYNSILGTIVLCLVDKKDFDIKMNDVKIACRMQYMNDFLVFQSPIKTMPWKGFDLSFEKIVAINRFIEQTFVTELYSWCLKHTTPQTRNQGRLRAIEHFAERLGIVLEEDITLDALRKAEYRFRIKRENSVTFVPSLKTSQNSYPSQPTLAI